MEGEFDVVTMNETDVRENILAPLLRRLGYKHGTESAIITEQLLRYPKDYLGHKKKSDPILRGKADYILEHKKRWRWVLEAKAGSKDITIDDREQAYSYARHPEVGAVYYAISNGKILEVFLTSERPDRSPYLTVNLDSLGSEFIKIKMLLSPDSLERLWGGFELNVGKPLMEGLRSFAKVENGWLEFAAFTSPQIPPSLIKHIVGLRVHFEQGVIQREGEGLRAVLILSHAFSATQKGAELLGIQEIDVSSAEANLSSDPMMPSKFEGSQVFEIPVGHELYDFKKGAFICPNPMAVVAKYFVSAWITNDLRLKGEFVGEMVMTPMRSLAYPISIRVEGRFDARISS